MPNENAVESSEADRERLSKGLKRTGFALLFSAVLLIPRVRRLRRSVLVWTLLRAVAVVAGARLAWGFVHGTTGMPSLLLAIGLALFGLLVKARPDRKSVDDVARELNALVVLNGGSWTDEGHSKPLTETCIFVLSDRLLVQTAKFHEIAEIPLASICKVCVQAALLELPRSNGAAVAEAWQTEVAWSSTGKAHTATFRFEGFFAEHLARVAEQTITSVWKKQLPVLRS